MFEDSGSETGNISIKKHSLSCKELLYEVQAIDRDVDGPNNFNNFKKSVVYLDGQLSLRIPITWLAVTNIITSHPTLKMMRTVSTTQHTNY